MYYQIAVYLRDSIRAGKWHSGDYLPPEVELAKTYNVSRVTIRQALAELVKDGLLSRQRGDGTVVTEHSFPIVHDLSLSSKFLSRLKVLGYEYNSRILEKAVYDIPFPIVAEKLQIDANQSVSYIRKLNLINDEPFSIGRSWLSTALCPGIIDSDLIDNSISSTLIKKFGLVPVSSDYWIETIRSTEKDITLLSTKVDIPLFLVTALSFLEDGKPLEYSTSIWLGDRIRFHIQVKGSPSSI